MRSIKFIVLSTIISASLSAQTSLTKKEKTDLPNQQVTLPNGWKLFPAGRSLPLGDLPLNIAVSADKKLIAVTNNGQSVQSIQLINPVTEKIIDNVVIPKSWYGLKFSADGKMLYASGGNDNWIMQYEIEKALPMGEGLGGAYKLLLKDTIKLGKKWPEKISPAGIEIDDAGGIMYVVTKENNSLYLINLNSKEIIQQIKLDAEAYACLLSVYVAGGFVKRKFVDHTMYSTSSMLRTIELILGLPPMSQYDAAAEPMWRCFTATPNLTSFQSVKANVNLDDKNEKVTASAKLSETFDFSKEDRIPDLVFSEVIWKAVKGEDAKMPAPRRSAFVKIVDGEVEKSTPKQKKK